MAAGVVELFSDNPMKHALLLCGLLISRPLLAVEISVGATRLSIPAPSGYLLVTSEMLPYAELAKRFVPPSNEQFALFLPEADGAAAARGEIPDPERWFYVQTSKALIRPFVSTGEFAQLKQAVKGKNEEILKKVESQLPGLLEKVNKGISSDYKIDLNLSIEQILPLPPHYETERSLAYSTLLKYKGTDGEGKSSVSEGVVTATFVHLQGKVLFLYVNAERSAIDWCRSESRKWADTVIAANPSTEEIATHERRPAGPGFNWNSVLGRAVAGAVIGGVLGTVGYVFRKRRG